MAQDIYTIEGRQFRTEADYARAKRDAELIRGLRGRYDFKNRKQLEELAEELDRGKYKFLTILGQDFRDEVEEQLRSLRGTAGKGAGSRRSAERPGKKAQAPAKKDSKALDSYVREELKRREKRRKITIAACSAAAVFSLGYFAVYSYFEYRTQSTYQQLSELKEASATETPAARTTPAGPLYTLDESPEEREVLEEYKNLLNKNKKLIGWLKIDDTIIDYPVMQTGDNSYYLEHNFNQEYDKNGSLFLDYNCSIYPRSTNLIIYGHHMKSGQMFGQLQKYAKQSYGEKHSIITFDSIYEKATYQVMYVFRSQVYNEDDLVFKYYQFIDANSKKEFDSYMNEMAKMSLYDTGVTASYGDSLLTLSTCDNSQTDGRFVVVAKRIK